MQELSLFVDESGSESLDSTFYIVVIIAHDQAFPVTEGIQRYEAALARQGMPDIPFHAVDLLNGHGAYTGLTVETRARLLSGFRVFFRHLPIAYKPFIYKASEYSAASRLSERLRRDLVNHLFDSLGFYQRFDEVKIYYDGGQGSVTTALHGAIDYALAKNSVAYKPADMQTHRLAQAADYLCTVELAEARYMNRLLTRTYEKFFGGHQKFKKGILKEARRKLL